MRQLRVWSLVNAVNNECIIVVASCDCEPFQLHSGNAHNTISSAIQWPDFRNMWLDALSCHCTLSSGLHRAITDVGLKH